MFKRILAAGLLSAALGVTADTAFSDTCVWLRGWGSSDNLGTAQAAAKVDLASRTEGWMSRHRRRSYEYCDGPTMHCSVSGGIHMCTLKAQACLK